MSDWKQMANQRREERQAKDGPEVPKHKPRRRRKAKPFLLQKMLKPDAPRFFFDRKGWVIVGRYAKREYAERELQKARRSLFGHRHNYRIMDSSFKPSEEE